MDDVAYLTALIAEIQAAYPVDPQQIFLAGHSNGGAMAHALGCADASRYAGLVSLAGPLGADPNKCAPSEPLAVLHIHGTADATVDYDGGTKVIAGSTGPCDYASAPATVAMWAEYNGCSPTDTQTGDPVDLDESLAGAETTVTRHTSCSSHGPAELWSIQNGAHMPALNQNFPQLIYDFLKANPKP